MNKQDETLKHALVVRDYHAQYSHPIAMQAGDRIQIGRRDEDYQGWIWCTHSDGRSGWVPESLVSIDGNDGRAQCDYTAKELSAVTGEVLELGEAHSGWIWATNSRGESGWLPIDHLKVE